MNRENSTLVITMSRYEIQTIEIKEETVEDDSSVEILDECDEDLSGKHNKLQNWSCRTSCRGQHALDKHLVERHLSGFVKEEWQHETSPPIVSTTVLPGALWTGERFLTFHHCPECHQSFQCLNSQGSVNLMRVQSGNKEAEEDLGEVAETVFHCLKCGKTFQHKGVLKVHHLTHIEARPYSCTKSFAQFDSLKLHNLSHSEETPYQGGASNKSLLANNVVKRSSQPCAVKHSYSCSQERIRIEVLEHPHCLHFRVRD
ncbi:hypothetical protein AAFF_G00405570 [Aldrovandia affinis]|uniref:C2H2-type domain-containing protein n=1 Tax=Aldrovandia affinis TaxID=143900 RepID=A0AAD7SC16_9TELE|nr:hypothetical protein AAFF_G00405570 [Aldrovandia affinis]